MSTKENLIQKTVLSYFVFTNFFQFVLCYTCSTPDSWLSGNNQIQRSISSSEELRSDFQHVRTSAQTWPGGVVKYKLNETLNLGDLEEITKAFDEYESKTCIRFEPASQDTDFVSIEVDNNACGYANVCKLGGYQFARFGSECRNMATMIHELGHTLCLSHEHQRWDRHKYINYTSCDGRPKKKSTKFYSAKGIYDYASQMHYECFACNLGGWPITTNYSTKCGWELTPGLSPLDVDMVNELYDCQDCHRHRWRSALNITDQDKTDMHNFGRNQLPLFACRASVHGEVSTGKYNVEKQSCNIAFGSEVVEVQDNVEVLTIPGGPDAQCSKYELKQREQVVVGTAISAGSSFHSFNYKFYIAFALLTTEDGSGIETLGKVGLSPDDVGFTKPAEFPLGNLTTKATLNYQVLTCSVDRECKLSQWIKKRNGCNN